MVNRRHVSGIIDSIMTKRSCSQFSNPTTRVRLWLLAASLLHVIRIFGWLEKCKLNYQSSSFLQLLVGWQVMFYRSLLTQVECDCFNFQRNLSVIDAKDYKTSEEPRPGLRMDFLAQPLTVAQSLKQINTAF